MEVIEIVKSKLPDPIPTDDLLNMYIEEVGETIKTYCNQEDIPVELRFVHANMVIDLITGNARRSDTDSLGNVKAIKEGDVQVTYEANHVSLREAHMEALLFDYRMQLNRSRKLRW